MNNYEGLDQFATVRQLEILGSIRKTKSQKKTAADLGVTRQNIQQSLAKLTLRAAMQGFSPAHDMNHIAPSPYVVKGVSTLYDAEGKPKIQWVKTQLDAEQADKAIREFIEVLVQDAKV